MRKFYLYNNWDAYVGKCNQRLPKKFGHSKIFTFRIQNMSLRRQFFLLFLFLFSLLCSLGILVFSLLRTQGKLDWSLDARNNALLLGIILLILFILGILVFSFVIILRQLTRSKKADEELRYLNLRLTSNIQRTPLAYIEFDTEGRVRDWNPAAVEMFGYSSAEAMGKHWSFILQNKIGEHPDGGWESLMNRIGGAKSVDENMTKDGSMIRCEWFIAPLADANGKPVGVSSLVKNITVREQAKMEQQVIYEIMNSVANTDNLTELLKLIHQSLGKFVFAENCFIALYDPKSNLFGFPYWVDQFDPPPEPISLGNSCTGYVFRSKEPLLLNPELFRQLKEQNELELIGSPSPSWIGVPLHTPSRTIGVLVLQHYEKENVYSEHDLQFLVSVGSQIAIAIERRQAEKELRESEIKLNVILQSTADGILAVNSRGEVIKTNRRFAELWRIPQELSDSGDDKALISFVTEQLVNPDEFTSKVDKLYHSTREDLDYLYFKDGRIFERYSAPMVMSNSAIGRVWSFRDVTESRNSEEKIKLSNEELHKLNASKDKFFSIIAHDLKSPFNSIIGFSELLVEQVEEKNYDGITSYAGIIHQSSQRAMDLLMNIMEW